MQRRWNAWRSLGAVLLLPSLIVLPFEFEWWGLKYALPPAVVCCFLFGPPLAYVGIALLVRGRWLAGRVAAGFWVVTCCWAVFLVWWLTPVITE